MAKTAPIFQIDQFGRLNCDDPRNLSDADLLALAQLRGQPLPGEIIRALTARGLGSELVRLFILERAVPNH